MKRYSVLGLFAGLVGLAVVGVLFTTAGSAGARGQIPSSALAGPDRPADVHAFSAAAPLTTTFSYQGQLRQNGTPVSNPACQIAFRMYDDPSAGNLIGSALTPTVPISNGLFTVGLNFGDNVFDGNGRWLDMQVNCGGGFAPLTPRQPLTAVPYAFALPGLYTQPNATSPSLIGGYSGNVITSTVRGGVIGGGGFSGYENRVQANYGAVGGGYGNTTSEVAATVAGGDSNTASGIVATVGGGNNNTASNWSTTVGGGSGNTASGSYATVGGGSANAASSWEATVGGGFHNTVSGNFATVSGGYSNTASYLFATVGGGKGNIASGEDATVGGGISNTVSAYAATVSGGQKNTASGLDATVGGGNNNNASGYVATVGGGQYNTASGGATVGGGDSNTAGGSTAAIGGGHNNTAAGNSASVGGGGGNTASGDSGTVGGGINNAASNQAATVSGGQSNVAGGYIATVGGGQSNNATNSFATIGGGFLNTASGIYATIPGGLLNTALGDYSLAAGTRAKANHNGTFVWGDSTDADIASSAPNQFLVRASGGITLYTNAAATVGAALAPGSGSWSVLSDRNAKANFDAVDARAVLAKLAVMPIQTWNYKTQDAVVRHIGPMAQDFYAAFQVGENDTTISSVDAQGVALAAIQGLVHENQALKALNASLEARLTTLEQNAQPAAFNAFNLLSVLAFGGFVVTWIQQRRAQRGQS